MIAIAAMSRNRIIGAEGRIPWHLPEDLQFFKRTTLGHVVVMGRKTYASIGKPLPGRENLVLSRQADIPGVRVVRSPEDIVEPSDGRKIFVIGGSEIYIALLPRCSEILLTLVAADVSGDTFFPAFERDFDAGEILSSAPTHQVLRYRRLATN